MSPGASADSLLSCFSPQPPRHKDYYYYYYYYYWGFDCTQIPTAPEGSIPAPLNFCQAVPWRAATPPGGKTGASQLWRIVFAKTIFILGWPYFEMLAKRPLTEVAIVFPTSQWLGNTQSGWVIHDLCLAHNKGSRLTRLLLVKPWITVGISDLIKYFYNRWNWNHVVKFYGGSS